jgi:hypothetical protein
MITTSASAALLAAGLGSFLGPYLTHLARLFLHPLFSFFLFVGCGALKLHTTLEALETFAFLVQVAFLLHFKRANRVYTTQPT